jgi:phosphate transport system substrate-binding protein
VLGGVGVAYMIPEFTDTLNFDGALIADIFLGRVTRWNDARILALNPGAALPDMEITTVHRSEGSGTTYVFTDYLSAVSADWAAGPGKGKDVNWPVGIGQRGNEQVAGTVKQTPGSIGYIESVYALQNQILLGRVRNKAGNFVSPYPETITAAAAEALPTFGEATDYRVSIIDAPGENAYPISSFTWLLVYKQQTDAQKGRTLIDFMKWAITDGQVQAAELHYGPLPEPMRAQLLRRIDSIVLP